MDARRRLRRQRDHRPDLRPGRRRRGAPLGVPRRAAQAATARHARPAAVRRLHRVRRPRLAVDDHARRSRTARRSGIGKGNAVLDAGSFKPSRPEAASPARASAHPRWASNFLLVGAHALGHRPPAVRRRPADRLHVPRPDARGRHQLARRAGARRDRAGLRGQHPDRPRAGLRVEPHVGGLGPDRQLRRDAVRRLEAPSTATRASAGRWGTVDAGHDQGLRAA